MPNVLTPPTPLLLDPIVAAYRAVCADIAHIVNDELIHSPHTQELVARQAAQAQKLQRKVNELNGWIAIAQKAVRSE